VILSSLFSKYMFFLWHFWVYEACVNMLFFLHSSASPVLMKLRRKGVGSVSCGQLSQQAEGKVEGKGKAGDGKGVRWAADV
jgi:hypothetical protein